MVGAFIIFPKESLQAQIAQRAAGGNEGRQTEKGMQRLTSMKGDRERESERERGEGDIERISWRTLKSQFL